MTNFIQAMINSFRAVDPPQPHRAPKDKKPLSPERIALMKELDAAKKTNGKAALGVVLTTANTTKDESSVQAMLHGMLGQLDRGKN